MKRINLFFLSAIFCLAGFISFAQNKSAEERAKNLTERMTKSLLLSSEQKEKVLALNTGVAQKNEAIRKNVNMTQEQKHEALKGNMEGRKASLKTILNEEQFKKFEKQEEKRKQEMKKEHEEHKGQNPPPAGTPDPEEL